MSIVCQRHQLLEERELVLEQRGVMELAPNMQIRGVDEIHTNLPSIAGPPIAGTTSSVCSQRAERYLDREPVAIRAYP